MSEDPAVTARFEIYRKQRTRRPHEPFVRLTGQGIIAINGSAYRLLGEPAAVTLLWAADGRVVGLRPAPSSDMNAFRLRPAGAGRVISARAFFRWAGIKADGKRRTLTMEDGVGCIRLEAEPADPLVHQPVTGED